MATRRPATSQLQAPLGNSRQVKNDNVGYPTYYDPDTRKPDFIGAPEYNSGNTPGSWNDWHARPGAHIAAIIKEIVCTILVGLAVLAVLQVPYAGVPTMVELFLRCIGIAFAFGASIAVSYRLGYVNGLPRHLNLAVTTFETFNGHVHWFGALTIYIVPAFLATLMVGGIIKLLPNATAAALTPLLYCVHSEETPLPCPVSVSNPVSVAGATMIVFCMSTLVALIIGHFDSYHRLEKLRSGKNHSYRATLRAAVGGMANFGVQLLSFLLWGLYGFDTWTYLSGAWANVFTYGTYGDPFNQQGSYPVIGLMWVLMPMAGGLLAGLIDWAIVGLEGTHGGKPETSASINSEVQVRSASGLVEPLIPAAVVATASKAQITHTWN
jgi:hypothetical protein